MDELYRFDETALGAALAELTPRHRTAFALLCATRVASAFQHPTVRRDAFVSHHAQLWQHLGEPMARPMLKSLHASIETLLPDEEGDAIHAEDAIAALLFAYRCALDGDPADAIWAAERAYNTLDSYVQYTDGLDPNAAGGEHAILRHPLIQAELRRQEQDLRALQDAPDNDPARLAALRDRAESTRLFG